MTLWLIKKTGGSDETYRKLKRLNIKVIQENKKIKVSYL